MRLDTHVHSLSNYSNQEELLRNMKYAGFDGGLIFSHSPKSLELPGIKSEMPSNEERMDAVLKYTDNQKYLFPFYFIDPTEPDAAEQVETAVNKGIAGFKIICAKHFPCDARALPVYSKIASLNKPILFHSGILYDGKNASGNYNRPCNFEGLLEINKLRFALAHVSWPWTDECMAVYGKFDNYLHYSNDTNAGEMFIDLSPGTPPIFRKSVIEKLFFVGYNLKGNILYGIDTGVEGPYSGEYAKSVVARDKTIFDELGIDDDIWDNITYKNILRFIGLPENY